MDKKIIALLNKIYFHENGYYNTDLDRLEHTIPSSVAPIDLKLLEEAGLKPNKFETFTHDNALARLLKIKTKEKITLSFASKLFLQGLSGEYPRGRQVLMSFLYTKHLKDHSFEGKDICTICGLPKKDTLDITQELYSLYSGHSWNEQPLHFLIDLEEIENDQEENNTATEDKNILFELLDFIQQADPKETPGKLEKRITTNKLLKNTDKYKRYGILQTLAECGILPNPYLKPYYEEFATLGERILSSKMLTTSHRSDIILPLGGWTGKDPVNTKRAEEIFGNRSSEINN